MPAVEPIVRAPEPTVMSAVVREVPQPETPSPLQPEQRFEAEPKVELREPEKVLHVETTPSIHSLVPPDQVEESTLIEAEEKFQSEPQSEPVEEVVEAPPPRIIPPKKKPAVAQKPTTPQVLPPPESPVEKRSREKSAAAKQEVLQFEPVTRGRFEKSEPTIVEGQDLDVPTFLRKNVRVK
jgi:cell division protein FtsZ